MKQLAGRGTVSLVGVVIVAVILAAIVGALIISHKHAGENRASMSTSTCLSQHLQTGSSGRCVRDAQTLVDFIETAGLTECPFSAGKVLPISGDYDVTTAGQVKVVQTWINCYNKQEGSDQSIPTNGSVDAATWMQLCTYGYRYPNGSRSGNSPYLKQTLVAGKDAGC